MKNSLVFVVLCALFTKVYILLPMDLPSVRQTKNTKKKKEGYLLFKAAYEGNNRIDCIAFVDDHRLFVGEQRGSSIIDIVANETWHCDVLADHIVSYPEQKLIVVTGPNGVGVYQVCLQDEKKIIEKGFKESTKKASFSGKAFLMNEGQNLVAARNDRIKLYSCENGKIGKALLSKYAPGTIPLCMSPNFSSRSFFYYKAHSKLKPCARIKTIEIDSKQKSFATKTVYQFLYLNMNATKFIMAPTKTDNIFFIWHHGLGVIFNEKMYNDFIESRHQTMVPSSAVFYTDSILTFLATVNMPKHRKVKIVYYDIKMQKNIFSRIITRKNSVFIGFNRAEIAFSPDCSKCAVLWNNELSVHAVPEQLWKETPQFCTNFVNKMGVIRHFLLPKDLSSHIIRFLFLLYNMRNMSNSIK